MSNAYREAMSRVAPVHAWKKRSGPLFSECWYFPFHMTVVDEIFVLWETFSDPYFPIPPSSVEFSPALSVSKTLQTLQLQIWKSKSLNLNSEYIWHWLACSKWKFEFTFSYIAHVHTAPPLRPCDRCWKKCGAMQCSILIPPFLNTNTAYLIFVIIFTRPQFEVWIFYTWMCVNLQQKLPRDKTAYMIV